MLIGYDASRAFASRKTGVENYSFQLLKAMLWEGKKRGHRFVVYVRSKESFQNSQVIPWPWLWTQGGLALQTWLHPPDILFVPAHTVPFLKNPRVKTVVTVHDLWTQDLPQKQNPVQRLYLNLRMERLRARFASHLIAVSRATCRDVVRLLGVPENKVSVVLEGVDQKRFAPEAGGRQQTAKRRRVLRKYGIRGEYLLFVGTLQPRKNLVRLVEAFGRVVKGRGWKVEGEKESGAVRKSSLQPPIPDLQLVLAGSPGWQTDEIYRAPWRFEVGERVKFLDYVTDQDLPHLYAGAHALMMPSLHEGFGLPVLEAMALGTPVVVSRVSSLPEVAGEVGVYVDPWDVKSIARGIKRVLSLSPAEYQKLSSACISRARQFSWQRAARETLAVLEMVQNDHGRE